VFAGFQPKLPPAFRDAEYVFLGNIDPELQLGVLDQVTAPRLVACDTMNYWIQSKRDVLLQLLRHIDYLIINDTEARELSGDWNIYRAARWVLTHGPRGVVIKQGEYGAILMDAEMLFKVPAYPLEEVFDPTGAGDAFAGGFMGHVARTGDLSPANLRLAMVYGAAMGSFAVEEFGIRRFDAVDVDEVEARVRAFRDLVHFDHGGVAT
jgi:sugar/nucleoside kinase (ribokinase family)